MKRARENYYNLAKRNSSRIWDSYFLSKDFLYLRKDLEFTTEFLQFISENNRFKKKTWHDSIHKNLMDWKRYWVDPDIERKFIEAINAFDRKFSSSSKGGKAGNSNKYVTFKPSYTIAFVLIIVAIISLIGTLQSRSSNALIMVFAVLLFPLFIFQENLSEKTFLYLVLAWVALITIFFVIFIWGILYAIQNGFNKESRKTFFHTVKLVLLLMLAGIADAICYVLTGFSIIMFIL